MQAQIQGIDMEKMKDFFSFYNLLKSGLKKRKRDLILIVEDSF